MVKIFFTVIADNLQANIDGKNEFSGSSLLNDNFNGSNQTPIWRSFSGTTLTLLITINY